MFLGNAILSKQYHQITKIGSRKSTTTYCVEDDWIWCGCWGDCRGGLFEDFIERVEQVYGKQETPKEKQYYAEYMAAIEFFKAMKRSGGDN